MEAIAVDLGGDCCIHALVTKEGIMFSMNQVAVQVFGENPTIFGKELRRRRYPRVSTLDTVTLARLLQLGIAPESGNVTSATLLPPNSLLCILDDRRRDDLIPKVQVAMLNMVIKEAKDLIMRGQYEEALPVAMDAVAKGQALYWPKEPLRMVPMYLLAVKVNLGLKRPVQSEDLLGTGSWLLLQDESDNPKDQLRGDISQLFGKLSMLNKLVEPSMKAFAEEVYYKSKEYGIYDVRTSIGFYNLSQVFHHLNQVEQALAFWDVVIYAWRVALEEVILGEIHPRELPWGKKEFEGTNPERLNAQQAIATLQIPEVCDMIQDICKRRSEKRGGDHVSVGEASYVAGLAFSHANKKMLALDHLQRAHEILQQPNDLDLEGFIDRAIDVLLEPPRLPDLASSPAPASPPPDE